MRDYLRFQLFWHKISGSPEPAYLTRSNASNGPPAELHPAISFTPGFRGSGLQGDVHACTPSSIWSGPKDVSLVTAMCDRDYIAGEAHASQIAMRYRLNYALYGRNSSLLWLSCFVVSLVCRNSAPRKPWNQFITSSSNVDLPTVTPCSPQAKVSDRLSPFVKSTYYRPERMRLVSPGQYCTGCYISWHKTHHYTVVDWVHLLLPVLLLTILVRRWI